SSVVRPGRWPVSRSACRTQRRSASVLHPSFSPTDRIVAHCDGCSSVCSNTIRTARSRSSGEYLLGRGMGSILSRNEPSDKPGAIHAAEKSDASLKRVTHRDQPPDDGQKLLTAGDLQNQDDGMAERVGFEPTVEFPLHTLSKRAPSTTRTSLRRLLESVVHGPVAEPVNPNCVRNCVRPPNVLGPLAVIWQSLATEG